MTDDKTAGAAVKKRRPSKRKLEAVDPQWLAEDGRLRTFSNGGGVQSTATLVLSARGELPYRCHLFCNVGDDSEHPGSVQFVRLIAQPYAAHHGIDLLELHRVKRDGSVETLMGRLTRPGSRSLPIPVRMGDTGAPGTRTCTIDFKIKVVAKWLKAHGASEESKAHVGIGISADESMRANKRRAHEWEDPEYPLLGLTLGRRLRRQDCERIIQSEPLPPALSDELRALDARARADGLEFDEFDPATWTQALYPTVARQLRETDYRAMPIPPKSSCYFCPFHRPSTWQTMKLEEPRLYQASVDLEAMLIERRTSLGKDPVFMTRFGVPLEQVIPDGVMTLPFADVDGDDADAQCDNGVCWT